MAEGRRDRSSRRRRRSAQGAKASSSDSELARSGGRRCFLHEGLDVDQLARYRRRRVAEQPRDHLGPGVRAGRAADDGDEAEAEEDEDEEEERRRRRRPGLVTEYRLAFQGSDDNVFRSQDIEPSPDQTKLQVPLQMSLLNSRVNKSETDLNLAKVMGSDFRGRPAPIRRPTTLRYEGEFSSATEYSAYVAYPGVHRPELRRRGTSLRMEGDFDSRTEKNDKFVEWPAESRQRPCLARLPTHLRLEGELETSTESHEKYVPFVGARRPEILRQCAQLKLEGSNSWTPEYTDVFREYEVFDRPEPKKHQSHLRPDGGFTEDDRKMEQENNELLEQLAIEDERERERERQREQEIKEEEEKARLQKEQEMKMLVSKLEDLKGPPLEIPEYKDAYKDFPRERPRVVRPDDEIGRADGSKVRSVAGSGQARFKSKIDQDPEYKSIYMEPSLRERASYQRQHQPTMAMSSSRRSSSLMGRRTRPEPVDYGPNYWLDNDNAEHFGTVNAAEDQDAFQMLHTRLHEESVVGRPPPGPHARGSRASASKDRVTGSLRHRSPSPSYRLQVSHVDEEPRGFGRRRRSPSQNLLVQPSRNRSPSPIQQTAERPYSPSFARENSASVARQQQQQQQQQAFVVLDNRQQQETRRRRTDRNYNPLDGLTNVRPSNGHATRVRNRTPPNWMPPWYDSSTSTI